MKNVPEGWPKKISWNGYVWTFCKLDDSRLGHAFYRTPGYTESFDQKAAQLCACSSFKSTTLGGPQASHDDAVGQEPSFFICWASSDRSDWEVVDGEDAMQVRCSELLDEGASTLYVFDAKVEIDVKEAARSPLSVGGDKDKLSWREINDQGKVVVRSRLFDKAETKERFMAYLTTKDNFLNIITEF